MRATGDARSGAPRNLLAVREERLAADRHLMEVELEVAELPVPDADRSADFGAGQDAEA